MYIYRIPFYYMVRLLTIDPFSFLPIVFLANLTFLDVAGAALLSIFCKVQGGNRM
jgi:hypothetical protein